jgi:hypothetical protein
MSMRGRARSAGAQITERHEWTMPVCPKSVGEDTR